MKKRKKKKTKTEYYHVYIFQLEAKVIKSIFLLSLFFFFWKKYNVLV